MVQGLQNQGSTKQNCWSKMLQNKFFLQKAALKFSDNSAQAGKSTQRNVSSMPYFIFKRGVGSFTNYKEYKFTI